MGHVRERPSREDLRADTRRTQAAPQRRSAMAACGKHRRAFLEDLGEPLVTRVRIVLSRLWALVRHREMDRDIDDEIASHLEEATDEYIQRGFSPEDARLAALRSFGGVPQTREVYRQVRSFSWLDDLGQDLRHTARSLVKNPVFTLVVILTLALGIGANTTIFTLLDAVIFKPLAVPTPTELVTLYEKGPEGPADITGGTGQYLRFSYPRFERLEQALGTKGSLAAVTRSSRFAV